MGADASIVQLAQTAAEGRATSGPRLPGIGDELAAMMCTLVPDQNPSEIGEVLLLIASLVGSTSVLLGASQAMTAEQLGADLSCVLAFAGERLYHGSETGT